MHLITVPCLTVWLTHNTVTVDIVAHTVVEMEHTWLQCDVAWIAYLLTDWRVFDSSAEFRHHSTRQDRLERSKSRHQMRCHWRPNSHHLLERTQHTGLLSSYYYFYFIVLLLLLLRGLLKTALRIALRLSVHLSVCLSHSVLITRTRQ